MNCRKCGKPNARQITDSNGVFLIRCLDCMMELAREAEQEMADAVERIMEIEIRQAETSRQLAGAKADLAEAEREQRHKLKESAIDLHGDCCTLIQLATRDLDPDDAARVKEAVTVARALARKVVTRRAIRTLKAAHAEMLAAIGAAIELAQEALAKRKGGA